MIALEKLRSVIMDDAPHAVSAIIAPTESTGHVDRVEKDTPPGKTPSVQVLKSKILPNTTDIH